jgi:ATP/maltotriose-dependent transcriptional regulator MalT
LGSIQASYVQQILAAFPKMQSPGRVNGGPPVRDAFLDETLIPVESLTPREMEVMQLIAAGDSNQRIADKLVITLSAVKKHTGNIFNKLSVNSRTQAVVRARLLGLLSIDS